MDVREQYLKNQVTGSKPEQLLILLLEGGERFIRIAQAQLAKNNIDEVHNNIVKAQDIYLELFCALDPEAGDFVQNLHGLYYYIYNNLMEADIKKDAKLLGNCLKVSQDLLKMWRDTVDKYHEETDTTLSDSQEQKSIDIRG